MKTYLISHVNKGGGGVAQATVTARNEEQALLKFAQEYPERTVSTVGTEGEETRA